MSNSCLIRVCDPGSEAWKEVEAPGEGASVFGRHLSSVADGEVFKTAHDLSG